MVLKKLRENFVEILYVSIFILIYSIAIYVFYAVPNNYNVLIGIFIGPAIVIYGIFFFINLNHKKGNSLLLQFKISSENSIKVILIISMSLALLIQPITSPTTIVIWKDVGVLNYIRAIVFIIGCGYLPGANLYNIIFPKNNLQERFKVEPFLLKITLYPLLSFFLLGTSVLILDQIGIVRKMFEMFLFLIILGLFFSDLFIQYIRENKINFKFEETNISQYSLSILIISSGVLIFAIFIHLGTHYLIIGDSWVALAPANHIGRSNTSPIKWGEANLYYPIYWAYVCFGFSILSGLPYININALLAPFCYLYVTSLYLLTKSILYNYKEKLAVLSTALITISSGFFIFTSSTATGNLPTITFVSEFYFIYKSYSYILLIIALAIFIAISKTNLEENTLDEKSFNINNYKLLSFAALFLVLSFMLYALPFLMGIIYIFLYCFFSDNKKQNLRLLSYLILFIIGIFISLDILMTFYLSTSMLFMVQWFFPLKIIEQISGLISISVFIYLLLLSLFVLTYIFQILNLIYFNNKNNSFFNFRIDSKKIFKFSLIIFTVFLTIEIVILIEEVFLDLNLNEKFTFFYYLDKIFINIGIIGILSVYFSYYCFLKDKKLFFVLISWILICFLIGSLLIFLFSFQSNSIKLNAIEKSNRFLMDYWFDRNWFYSIIPLSILAAIGLMKVGKLVNNKKLFKEILKNRNKKRILKLSSLSLLIVLSYSNLIFAGIWAGNIDNRPDDEEIEIISWMSENIPRDSNFLIEYNYYFQIGIFSMVNGRSYYIHHIFKSDYNETENIDEIEELIDEKIEYLLVSEDFLYENENRSRFFSFYLIPKFYNESEYRTRHYRLYYAPYFD